MEKAPVSFAGRPRPPLRAALTAAVCGLLAVLGGVPGALLVARASGAEPGGFERLGGTVASGPAASAWGAGRLDVFARGPDGHLWHVSLDAGAWRGWESLGGSLGEGRPGAVSRGPNRLDVFVRAS